MYGKHVAQLSHGMAGHMQKGKEKQQEYTSSAKRRDDLLVDVYKKILPKEVERLKSKAYACSGKTHVLSRMRAILSYIRSTQRYQMPGIFRAQNAKCASRATTLATGRFRL